MGEITIYTDPEQVPEEHAVMFADELFLSISSHDDQVRFMDRLRERFPALFAKREFESTGSAYDQCQYRDSIKSGDMLIIPDEAVIGLAWAWPVAVTAESGKLHEFADPGVFDEFASREQVAAAIAECNERGWPVAAGLAEWISGGNSPGNGAPG